MRLVTVAFNYPAQAKRPDYLKLLEVFDASIARHMPECEIRSLKIDPPEYRGVRKVPFLSNTYKLKFWAEQVREAVADGEELILSDCDMVCVGDAAKAFSHDFDVAYTLRHDHTNLTVNGGVLFVKPTDAAAHFFEVWAATDARMYDDWNFHQPWRIKYGGMNQASFGYLLENRGDVPEVRLLDLPTRVYNAVNTDWGMVSHDTVFIHVKSDLRKAVLTRTPPGAPIGGAPQDVKKARVRAPAQAKWYEEAGIDMRVVAR